MGVGSNGSLKFLGIGLVLVFLVTMCSATFAARTTDSATLDGLSVVTVFPGQTITANVTGTITSGDDWAGTGWEINDSQSSFTCVNTPDHGSNGTYNESFSVTAPTTPGTYNTYFRISGSNTCSNQNGSTLTLVDAVIVVLPPTAIDVPAQAFQGEVWNFVNMDCPDMGISGDECLVEWTGPTSGSFIEGDSNPDPDSSGSAPVLFV